MTPAARGLTLVLLTLSFLLASCGQRPLKIELAGEEAVTFNRPADAYIATPIVFDTDNQIIPEAKLRWYSVNSKIADVTPDGVITPRQDGETRVVVRAGYAQREIDVRVRIYDKLLIPRSSVSLPVGLNSLLTAQVLDRRGKDIGEVELEWSSDNEDVAYVKPDGTVVALSVGRATITASVLDLSGTIEVEVTPPLDEPAI